MTKNALSFTAQDSSLMVGGKTFLVKDTIKNIGGRWNPATKKWSISTADMLVTKKLLLDAYAVAEAQAKAQAKTQAEPVMTVSKALTLKAEGQQQWNWICCEHCVVHDWHRQHTTCSTHANIHPSGYGTDFRVRGILYYGD